LKIDPFEHQSELAGVDLDVLRTVLRLADEPKRPALESLAHDAVAVSV